ncbi:hypothetical protein GCM10009555_002760 [Acrocarpospora macrocephala]|uniref:DUF2127 domain-containing protein n=1 Tax=Acrocarpospora macrocephala TaxID=150177 RepID=A0A5M3WWS5_9ACTN|nr:hypothetical protein [Acrocarpospora macrocephala]GES11751.1 hypothetical protein Amac_053480 [Acrocarpospora macrocephala]
MKVEDAALTGGGSARRLDLIGRGLLAFAAVGSIGAFVEGCWKVAAASDDRIWVEFWRTSAYLVVAGLFALLALSPRTHWGVWELLFGQKAALVVFAVVVGDVLEARRALFVDLGLVLILVASYVLCRGWYAWRTRAAVLGGPE